MAALTSPSQHTTKHAQKNTRKLWHEMKYMKAVNSARTLVMVKAASHVDTFFSILWTATITSIQNPPLPIRQTTVFQALKVELPSHTVRKTQLNDGSFLINQVASQQQSEHIQTYAMCMTTAFMQNFCSDRICGRQSGDYTVLCVGEVQFFCVLCVGDVRF
jgi:hypothetical protein